MQTIHGTIAVAVAAAAALVLAGCVPAVRVAPSGPATKTAVDAALPAAFTGPASATPATAADVAWRAFFTEPALAGLIDAALANNQELNILLQEVEAAKNEARARSGEYLPSVGLRVGTGTEKVGRYTRKGAVEDQLEVKPGEKFPEPLGQYGVATEVSWEVDIWGRLRKATKAAVLRYAATEEGRQFMVTRLVAEIARTWYELVALDRRLELIERTIGIQENALAVVRLQKVSGRATELAVRRFEAEVLRNRTRQFEVRQQITEAENRLNYLAGRYPEPIDRSVGDFEVARTRPIEAGSPADLLAHRPDVRRAELELEAAALDVQAARARFYPALGINGAVGLESFELSSLTSTPASVLYGISADLTMPLLNRRAIEAAFRTANARQIQALYEYQRTLLAAFVEVSNQMARIRNLDSSYTAKERQVEALGESIELADRLFRSARADYLEVLLTQREALESRIELVEIKQQQLDARVTAYQALGGGVEPAPAPPPPHGG
jgi:NodT family efflux transporter outer membrane factor (OMF) lipoprotein